MAGAFDQRIALTMPIESGSGGVGAFRSIARESGAQPLSSAYGEQPWLGDAFGSCTGNPNSEKSASLSQWHNRQTPTLTDQPPGEPRARRASAGPGRFGGGTPRRSTDNDDRSGEQADDLPNTFREVHYRVRQTRGRPWRARG
nr:hypothetical protein [Streptomyces carminius]